MFLTRAHFNTWLAFREAMPPGVRVSMRPFGTSNPGLVEVVMESMGRRATATIDVGDPYDLKGRAASEARKFKDTTEPW